jgi:SPW repeat
MDTVLHHRRQVITASGLDILAGIWLVLSPFVLGYPDIANATSNDVIFGILIGILAAIRFFGVYVTASLSWVNAIFGLWILVSPWFLEFYHHPTPLWNNVILGILVMILAGWSAMATSTELQNTGQM